MSAAEEDAVELSLAPQWLRGHGLHSPIGAASAKSGRQLTLQQQPSSRTEPSLDTPQHRSTAQGFGSSRSEERPSGFRSPARRSYGSNRPYSSNRSSRASLEDRYKTLSSPFSSSAAAAKQSSNSSVSNGTSATSWLSRNAGQPTQQSLRPGGTSAGSQGPSQVGVHGARGRSGLQRAYSEGGNAAGSSSSKVSRKLALDPQDFPSLGGNSSSTSSRRSLSPEPYIPSIAPYKQEFLSSRGSLGWTSKLAAVPGTSSDGAESDGSGCRGSTAAAAAVAAVADSHSSQPTLSKGVGPTQEQAAVADMAPPSPLDQSAAATPAAAVEAAVLSPAPSLAETLKHAAAASPGGTATADAPRRHQSALVPLLPVPKAVIKQGAAAAGRASTARHRDASKSKAAAANRPKPLGPPAAVPSQAVVSSQPTLVPLGHISSNSSSSSSGPIAASPAVSHAEGLDNSTSSNLPTMQQLCKVAGSTGTTAAAEQRQQLRDRHNFFAVLRRKTSSNSSGSGVMADSIGSAGSGSGSGSVTSHGAADSATVLPAGHPYATAAVLPASADVADPNRRGDVQAQDQRQHAGGPQITDSSSRCLLDAQGVSGAQDPQPDDAAQAAAEHCDQREVSDAAQAIASTDSLSSSKSAAQLYHQTADACSAEDQSSKHTKPVLPSNTQSSVTSHSEMQPAVPQELQHCASGKQHVLNGKQQQHSHSITWDLPSEEEEEAFLRSLGWTAGSSDDEEQWELTEEEIAAFQAAAAIRVAQLQQRQHMAEHGQEQLQQQKMIGAQVGGCNGKGLGLNAFAGYGQQRQRQVVCASGEGRCGLYGVPATRQSHAGYMLGVYTAPAVSVLECDTDSSDSSEDD